MADDASSETTESTESTPIWQRLEDETPRWYSLFCLYRDAGPARSLMAACHQAEAMRGKVKPSKSLPGSWWKANLRHQWKARVEAFDAHLRKQGEAEIQRIMTEGLAATHNRVARLTALVGHIEASYIGPDGQAIPQFLNALLIRELRGAIDDIAREVGGRNSARRHEITGKDGGPLETSTHVVFYVPEVDQDDDIPSLPAPPGED